MKSFTELLQEAKFPPAQINKVVNLMMRLTQKKIGQKLYRYGGNNGTQEIAVKGKGKGTGYMFFTQRKGAIRFNFVKNELISINVWKQFAINKASDAYIDLGGFNVVQSMDFVIDTVRDTLKKPVKKINIPIYMPEHTEASGDLVPLTEAARVSPEEFYEMMQRELPNADLSNVHWRDIANVAAKYDKQVPGYVKAQKLGKGWHNVIPGEKAETQSKTSDPIYYVKITPQDPTSKKFLSAKDDKRAQEMLKKVSATLNANPSDQEMENPDNLFGALAKLTKLVIQGTNKALLIYGGPGTGKTYTITNTIKDAGLVKNQDWYHVKGKVTTSALYQLLFMHRKGKIIVFDDADSVFGTEDSANVLKAALDSYDERIISWISTRTTNVGLMDSREREEYEETIEEKLKTNPEDTKIKLPSEFKYHGSIIFISNLPEDKIDSAVLSRSFKIDMTLTDAQMFARMESVIDHLGEPTLSREQKLDILQTLRDRNMLGELKQPNMRTFVAASKIAASGIPDWIDLLKYS